MRNNKNLAMLFLIAFASMLVPFIYTSYPLSDDAWQHIQKAECYLSNGGFPFRAFYDLKVEDCISFPNYPPLFDILLGFGRYFGGVMFFARFFPSLLAALAVFAFYPLARKFLDEEKSLLAAALAVFAPEFMVLGSTNAQPQILGIIFSLLCFNSLLSLMESPKDKRHCALTALWSVLLVYTYTTYIFFVYFVIFVVVLLKKRYSFIKDMAFLALSTAVISMPLLLKYFAFPPPNAGFNIARKIVLDSYWYLIPIRVGLPAIVLAFFSRLKSSRKKVIYPLIIFLFVVSFLQLIAPFPPARNLAFLLFPLAILGADGWPYLLSRLKIAKYHKPLAVMLVLASIIAGISAVYFFAGLETATDEEYNASLWLIQHPGKIATFNWGPFNYRQDMQYNGNIFDDLEKIEAESIDYIVLTSKTPEIYGISNQEAVSKLEGYCDVVFNEKEIYILECG